MQCVGALWEVHLSLAVASLSLSFSTSTLGGKITRSNWGNAHFWFLLEEGQPKIVGAIRGTIGDQLELYYE